MVVAVNFLLVLFLKNGFVVFFALGWSELVVLLE